MVPPPVLRTDWEILARLASRQSKLLDLDACPVPTSLRRFCNKTDKPRLAWFWDQTKKPSRWFWGLNHQTGAVEFEAQTGKHDDIGFEAQPRNQRSSSPCAWCKPHTVSPDLYLIIPSPLYQTSYSCLDPRHCPPCHICYLHTMRQASVILHMNKGNIAELRKCPEFEFKHRHVNDSLHIKPRDRPLSFSRCCSHSVAVVDLMWLLLEGPVPQAPQPQSQRAPPPEKCTTESHAAGPTKAACPLVPTDQLADV
jgi:hypothetical protein